MFLAGIWHGAGWNFVIWGMLHGSLLIINHTWRLSKEKLFKFKLSSTIFTRVFSRAFTYCLVVLTWVIFRSPDFNRAITIWKSMFGFNGFMLPEGLKARFGGIALFMESHYFHFGKVHMFYGPAEIWLILLSFFIIWFLPNTHEIFQFYQKEVEIPSLTHQARQIKVRWQSNWYWAIFLMVISLTSFYFFQRRSEFLYFQF